MYIKKEGIFQPSYQTSVFYSITLIKIYVVTTLYS